MIGRNAWGQRTDPRPRRDMLGMVRRPRLRLQRRRPLCAALPHTGRGPELSVSQFVLLSIGTIYRVVPYSS